MSAGAEGPNSREGYERKMASSARRMLLLHEEKKSRNVTGLKRSGCGDLCVVIAKALRSYPLI